LGRGREEEGVFYVRDTRVEVSVGDVCADDAGESSRDKVGLGLSEHHSDV
jgi:hypothetical protein